jgi:hypothetical protein
MQQRAESYQIVDSELYKISISGPLLRCVSKTKGQDILSVIHVGICGGYIGARALAAKVLQHGFYWPIVIDDAAKLVKIFPASRRPQHNQCS